MKELKNHEHAANVPPEDRMRALISVISSYIEQYHGGFVEMVSFDGDVLQVRLGGNCETCALSETTLRGWVEGSVRQFFPELERVEAVE
jgi:Fe-S cluster biogenesis protein NfuA